MRVHVTREDRDGTVLDCTAEWDGERLWDIRLTDGLPAPLPPGSRFVIEIAIPPEVP